MKPLILISFFTITTLSQVEYDKNWNDSLSIISDSVNNNPKFYIPEPIIELRDTSGYYYNHNLAHRALRVWGW